MPLVLRRTTSPHVPEWDRDKFWNVFHEDVYVGSIVETHGSSDEPAYWSWSVIIHAAGMKGTGGSARRREAAMVAFREAFDRTMADLGAGAWKQHVEHMRKMVTMSGEPG